MPVTKPIKFARFWAMRVRREGGRERGREGGRTQSVNQEKVFRDLAQWRRTREEEKSEKVRRNGGLIITTWEV